MRETLFEHGQVKVSQRLINLILGRLSLHHRGQVFGRHGSHLGPGLDGGGPDVGEEDHVRQ